MFDALIVGARCAGSPVALRLARDGHRVLLVDRATFPSDTLSTHFIQLPGMERLRRWGVLDDIVASNCPPVTSGTIDIAGDPVGADFDLPPGIPGLLSPRRTVLDQILVDAAVSAGAELREGVYVDSLLVEGSRVVGVKGHGPDGQEFTERARIVIGADGRNSIVARSVEAETLVHEPSLSFGYYSYYSGVPCHEAELFLYDRRFAVAFPTNDGLTVVAAGFPLDELQEVRRAPEENFLTALDAIGTLGTRVRGGKREERLVGMIDLPNFIRRAQGPGWALCGDAGYHKDPGPAEGISDAFRAADTLADAVHSFLVGDVTEQHAMEGYDRQHFVAAKPLFDRTITMASFNQEPVARATAFIELGGLQQAEYDRLATMEVAKGAA